MANSIVVGPATMEFAIFKKSYKNEAPRRLKSGALVGECYTDDFLLSVIV